jgi:ParB family chromosome partitioning protein
MDMNGWNGKELADAIRVPQTKVSRALALLKLPIDIQDKVAAGEVSARSAYEISRLPDDETRRTLAEKASEGLITHEDAAKAVRQRKGKPKALPRGTRETFVSPDGWKVMVTANRKGTYSELEQALLHALDAVRAKIRDNVALV